MKKADIQVGESYRTKTSYPFYGARVKVLEIGLERGASHRRQKNGVRVLVERSTDAYLSPSNGTEKIISTRDLDAPWTTEDDQYLDNRAAHKQRREELSQRLKRVPEELGEIRIDFGGRVTMTIDTASDLLDRAGIAT